MQQPINQMLKKFAKQKKSLFCVPSHKGKLNNFDITELSFSDNLLNAKSVIKESQDLTAKIFEAKECFYSTCGTTASIFIMLHAVKNFGKKIIISKNSHKSVYNAIELFNIEPVILEDLENIESFLDADVLGALITYPDYFGKSANIIKISKTIKKHNKLFLADSAHGGHFCREFNLINPNNYCDIVCISGFKTLNGLTQGSYVLLNNLSLKKNILDGFNMFHTTSPSYVILESLEKAAVNFQKNKNNLKVFNYIDKILSIGGLSFEKTDDKFRVILSVSNLNATGFTAEKFLNSFNIYPEFSTLDKVVFIISYNQKVKDIEKLIKALKKLKTQEFDDKISFQNFIFETKLNYQKAVKSEFKFVRIEDAEGGIAAQNLGFYPPATPIILAGQVLTLEFCEFLKTHQKNFYNVQNGSIKIVKR